MIRSLGMEGISKSEVSRLCLQLDEQVSHFRNSPLDKHYPYIWRDAAYLKVSEQDRVLSMAMLVAFGVAETGEREILGLDLGPSEDGGF